MKKIILFLFSVFLLQGCLNPPGQNQSQNQSPDKGIYKSVNEGKAFEHKVQYEVEGKTLGVVNVLDIKIDPNDSNIIYVGTKYSGLFKSTNGGELWKHILTATDVYSIAIDRRNSNAVYAATKTNGQGKILKTEDGGENWRTAYVEPHAKSNFVSAMVIDDYNPNVVYAGNTRGLIYKTYNQGADWLNIGKVEGGKPIAGIVIDSQNRDNIYLNVFDEGLFKIDYKGVQRIAEESLENEEAKRKFENYNENKSKYAIELPPIINLSGNFDGEIFKIVPDPNKENVFYVATNLGLYKSEDGGMHFGKISTLESPDGVPIRAMGVAHNNSDKLFYATMGVFYKSLDGGDTWQSYELNAPNYIEELVIQKDNSDIIYLGIRQFEE